MGESLFLPLLLKGIFTGCWISGFILSTLGRDHSMFWGLHCFIFRVNNHLSHGFPVGNAMWFSSWFGLFSLYLCFLAVWLWYPAVGFCVYSTSVCQASNSFGLVFLMRCGNLQPLFFQIFFCPIFSFFPSLLLFLFLSASGKRRLRNAAYRIHMLWTGGNMSSVSHSLSRSAPTQIWEAFVATIQVLVRKSPTAFLPSP